MSAARNESNVYCSIARQWRTLRLIFVKGGLKLVLSMQFLYFYLNFMLLNKN